MSSFAIGDELDVTIERLVAGGDGLARHGDERFVILVSGVAPGERHRVRVHAVERRLARAVSLANLSPSPERVEPICPHQSVCGGCSWMHLDLELQRRTKQEILAETLIRTLGADHVPAPRMLASPGFGYRLRARFVVEAGRLGYRIGASRDFVGVERCPILLPELERCLAEPPAAPLGRGELSVAVGECGKLAHTWRDAESSRRERGRVDLVRRGETEEAVSWMVGPDRFEFAPEDFFQANATLLTRFQEAAVEGASGNVAWEFHAGIGFFTVALARRFDRVEAVEAKTRSVRRATRHALRQGISNVQQHAATAERWLSRTSSRRPDFCLLDPPRRGARELCLELARRAIPRIHYVSCNPATLARDLVPFLEAGAVIDDLILVDQFPQTPHIEAMVKLVRT
ncbi:MAG: class I SAM-dependent RNA methyltransferase [Planctomycetes bacterium]|nr:class I SAM-dependent RNA methyltransferase [Planctomycetota bacterium]